MIFSLATGCSTAQICEVWCLEGVAPVRTPRFNLIFLVSGEKLVQVMRIEPSQTLQQILDVSSPIHGRVSKCSAHAIGVFTRCGMQGCGLRLAVTAQVGSVPLQGRLREPQVKIISSPLGPLLISSWIHTETPGGSKSPAAPGKPLRSTHEINAHPLHGPGLPPSTLHPTEQLPPNHLACCFPDGRRAG